MNENELYITLLALQGELQNTITELFGMLCVEHKHANSTNTKRAFSNILRACKHLENVETLEQGFNKNKLYDTNEDGTFELRDEINLKILDSLLLFDFLKNVKGFHTYQKNLQRRRQISGCKQALHQQCCLACNHKCINCNRKICKNQTCHVGEKCNQHPCRNCDEKKEICLHYSSVCCKKCNTCYYCGNRLKLDQNKKCNRLRLVQAISILRNFRILLETLTFDQCKLFIDGTKSFQNFPLCRNLPELSEKITDAFKEILSYVSTPENFKKQHALPQKLIEWKTSHVASIFKHKDIDLLLYSQQEDIRIVLAFTNESKVEPSYEYTTVIKKIEELNNNEGFKTRKSVILLDEVENEEVEIRRTEEDMNDGVIELTSQHTSDSETSDEDEEEDAEEIEEEDENNSLMNNEQRDENEDNDKELKNEKEVEVENNKENANYKQQIGSDNANRINVHERSELKEVIDEILLSINQLKESSKNVERHLLQNFEGLSKEQAFSKTRQEEVNNLIVNKLSEITEKLITIESDMRETKEIQKMEIEEIKRNQKNLMDLLQPKQKGESK